MAHIYGPQSDPQYDPHYAAIGRLTEAWAHLEFAIDQGIWQLAHAEQAFCACITSQLIGVNKRMDAYRALFTTNNGSDVLGKKIDKFSGSLSALQEERHRSVHDPRAINKVTRKMDRMQITAKRKLVFGWQSETVKDLMQTRNKISDRIFEFQTLHNDVMVSLFDLNKESGLTLPHILYRTRGEEFPTTEI